MSEARRALRPAPPPALPEAQGQGMPALPAAAARRPEPARRRGGVRWLVALGVVAFAGYAAHQFLVASDVYATEVRFAVRQADSPRMSSGAGLLGAASMLGTVTESNAVVQYLRSRDALDEMESRIPLRALFGRAGIDWLARLPEGAPPEVLLRYMAGQVRPYFDQTSGIVTVEVHAFSAEEARDLAVAVETLSEGLVNRMSLSARRGLLATVEGEVAEAEAKLSALRDRMRAYRDASERLDARRSAVAADTLRAKLEGDISAQRALLDQQRRYLSENSPALRQQRDRLEALEGELQAQIRRNTGTGEGALPAALRDYEALEADTAVAQKSYEALLATLERTRSDANRQQIYLAHVVRPSLPGSATYPRRWRNLGTAAALGLLGGLLLLLLVRTVKEHVR